MKFNRATGEPSSALDTLKDKIVSDIKALVIGEAENVQAFAEYIQDELLKIAAEPSDVQERLLNELIAQAKLKREELRLTAGNEGWRVVSMTITNLLPIVTSALAGL